MLVEPITIAAAAPTPALNFVKIRTDGYGSEYVDSGGNGYSVIINNIQNRQNQSRTFLQITREKEVTDPSTGLVRKVKAYAALTIMKPSVGFDDASLVALSKALTDFRDDADVTTLRLVQRQS